MIVSVKQLFDYKLEAPDGEVGKVHNLLFDDDDYRSRYLVVESGIPLFTRKLLVDPQAVSAPDMNAKLFTTDLTHDQLKHSPELDAEPPLSKEGEIAYRDYFQWPRYWASDPIMGAATLPAAEPMLIPMPAVREDDPPPQEPGQERDINLRSAHEVMTYDVREGDNTVGEVRDLLVDTETWDVTHVVAELAGHPEHKSIAIPVRSVARIGFPDKVVWVDLPGSDLVDAPAYTNGSTDYEGVRDYYARKTRV